MSMYVNSKDRELRDIAKSLGLRGWSKLRKANLISFITNNEKQQCEAKRPKELEARKAKREDQANRRKARQEKRNKKIIAEAKAIKEQRDAGKKRIKQ